MSPELLEPENSRIGTRVRLTRRQFIKAGGSLGLVTAAGLLAACQPAPPTTAPTAAPQAAATAAPTQEVAGVTAVPGKVAASPRNVLTVAVPLVPQNLDRELNTSDPQMNLLNTQVVDPLVQWKKKQRPDGQYDLDFSGLDPVLVESWELSDGGRTVTFNLRQGVKSSAGNEFTAEGLKWNFDRGFALQGVGLFFMGVWRVDSPDDIRVNSRYSLSMTAREPSSIWVSSLPQHFISPLDADEYRKHTTADDPWALNWGRQNLVSYGPYQIESRTVGQEMVLTPNPNYWGPRPTIERLIWKEVPDPAVRYSLLNSGDVDVAEDLSFRQMAGLQGQPGVKLASFKSTRVALVAMQTENAPFTDKRVRQALTWAVPYEDIQRSVYFGLSSLLRGPLTEITPGFDGSLWPYRQDLERARSLLAEAGFGGGLQTELTYAIGLPEDEPMMLLLQSAFRQVGVEARLDKLTPAGLSEKVFTYQYQMGLTHGGANNPDPYYAFFLFYHGDSQQNVSRWGTPESDQLIYDGLASQDQPQRLEWARRVQEICIDECPYLNMAEPGVHIPMRDNIFGATLQMNRVLRYADLEKR